MIRALVPIAEGVEEMEAVIIIDTLRRANWDVLAAGLGAGTVTASRGVRLVPDAPWSGVDPAAFDILLLPGGNEGTRRLAEDGKVLRTVRDYVLGDKWVAAICAAPLVLQAAGVLEGRRVTCHPGARASLTAAIALDDRVVVDERLITSQGPGTAIEFALTVIRLVDGPAAGDAVAKAMVC